MVQSPTDPAATSRCPLLGASIQPNTHEDVRTRVFNYNLQYIRMLFGCQAENFPAAIPAFKKLCVNATLRRIRSQNQQVFQIPNDLKGLFLLLPLM